VLLGVRVEALNYI